MAILALWRPRVTKSPLATKPLVTICPYQLRRSKGNARPVLVTTLQVQAFQIGLKQHIPSHVNIAGNRAPFSYDKQQFLPDWVRLLTQTQRRRARV
jgi:hypothetical protein